MKCSEIHPGTACEQEIPEGERWRYCPLCGARAGRLHPPEARFRVARGQREFKVVTVSVVGLADVPACIRLLDPFPGVELRKAGNCVVSPVTPHIAHLTIPPLKEGVDLGTLEFVERDAVVPLHEVNEPEGVGPWVRRIDRTLLVKASVEVDAPARVYAVQELLYFRAALPERQVTLVNGGGAPVALQQITCPQGYEVDLPPGITLQPHGEASGVVRAIAAKAPVPSDAIVFRFGDGASVTVQVRFEEEHLRVLTDAVIGIDFGTTNTTVTFRKCHHNPDVPDDVRYLRPEGEDQDRFLTSFWLGRDGTYSIGKQARDRYQHDPGSGFLFREIKSLLRDPTRANVLHSRFATAAIECAKGYYGEEWPQGLVTRYLSYLRENVIAPRLSQEPFGLNGNVHYVFSVPVLDYSTEGGEDGAPIYERQIGAMRACVADAGFPMDHVEFHLEPACAALALIHAPAGMNWPELGSAKFPISDGHQIAVFDSGGGTTDIALMKASVAPDGTVALDLLRCMGVGSEAEAFGGERITKDIMLLARLVETRPAGRNLQEWVKWLTPLDEALKAPLYGGSANVPDAPRLQELAYDTQFDVGSILGGLTEWYVGKEFNVDDIVGRQPGSAPVDPHAWLEEKANTLKRVLSSKRSDEEEAGWKGMTTKIRSSLLRRLVAPYLTSMSEPLGHKVFRGHQSDVQYYLPVGGNMAVRAVHDWVMERMNDGGGAVRNRQLVGGDEQRALAVAYGAAWLPDARLRNAVPYGLHLRVGADTLARVAPNTLQDLVDSHIMLMMPAGFGTEVTVDALLDGIVYRVAQAPVANTAAVEATVSIRAGIQNGCLRIHRGGAGDEDPADEPLLEYRL